MLDVVWGWGSALSDAGSCPSGVVTVAVHGDDGVRTLRERLKSGKDLAIDVKQVGNKDGIRLTGNLPLVHVFLVDIWRGLVGLQTNMVGRKQPNHSKRRH